MVLFHSQSVAGNLPLDNDGSVLINNKIIRPLAVLESTGVEFFKVSAKDAHFRTYKNTDREVIFEKF